MKFYMIKRIGLKNIPSFAYHTVIEKLKEINYFYGANATGKTFIFRVLGDINSFSGCKLDYTRDSPPSVQVYNRDIVKKF